MLIDIKRRMIFIAGLKTGSTSIERVLGPEADIRIVRTEWGKHDSLAIVQSKYEWLFRNTPINSFFKWGVIREPSDWLWSLYKSHKDPKFSDRPEIFTGNMQFDEFFFEWRRRNGDQCAPQHTRFLDRQGNLSMDLIIPYDMLEIGMKNILHRCGLDSANLPRLNESPSGYIQKEGLAKVLPNIKTEYERDFEILERSRVADLWA